MHESHQDTWNYSKRKPRQLRGTPANKYGHLIAGGITVAFAVGSYLFTNADFMEEHMISFIARAAETQFDKEWAMMGGDPLLASVIRNVQERRVAKGYSLDVDTAINNREMK